MSRCQTQRLTSRGATTCGPLLPGLASTAPPTRHSVLPCAAGMLCGSGSQGATARDAVNGYSATKLARMYEGAGNFYREVKTRQAFALCLINDEMIFEALEVNYPMLISPILM
eukprot:365991-Rhodomonas_salina.1